jgi:hypothetical protein
MKRAADQPRDLPDCFNKLKAMIAKIQNEVEPPKRDVKVGTGPAGSADQNFNGNPLGIIWIASRRQTIRACHNGIRTSVFVIATSATK